MNPDYCGARSTESSKYGLIAGRNCAQTRASPIVDGLSSTAEDRANFREKF